MIRKFTMLLIIISATGGCQGPSGGKTVELARGNGASGVVTEAKIRVNGMSCPNCSNNITQQLKRLPGVRGVSIDLGAGIAAVVLDKQNRPTDAELFRAVKDSGFTPVSISVAGGEPVSP